MGYDHTSGKGNDNLVMADKGEVSLSNSGQYMILVLNNGKQYQKVQKRKSDQPGGDDELVVMEFKMWRKVFDLTEFKMSRTDESLFKTHFVMYNTRQLERQADSMELDIKNKYHEIRTNEGMYLSPFKDTGMWLYAKVYPGLDSLNLPAVFNRKLNSRIMSNAILNVNSMINSLSGVKDELSWRKVYYSQYKCEWYRKFSLSFACIVLLFVGSVMGAIMRKGGFGVPILISVLYFVLFHVLNVTGEKLAKADVVPVFLGMWLSTIVLMPLAFVLTYKAVNDSVLFRGEWYKNIFYAVSNRVSKIVGNT
jgi:lipopolysaccharide export system permease protein